jgi:hypothetical protein
MLRSTLSTGFLHDPQSGGNPGPAANSAKPDEDGHRACPMTHGAYGLPPPPGGGRSWPSAVPTPGADRDRSTRTGYLAGSQHRTLPASRQYPQTANKISRRGPGQRPEPTTGEPTFAIGHQGNGNDHDSRPYRRDMISAASVDWPLADAAGQPGAGIAAAFSRLRVYAYARDRSVPGLVRDIVVRRLRSCPGLGPRWDGQA